MDSWRRVGTEKPKGEVAQRPESRDDGQMKYGVSKLQWDDMAKHNDYDQVKLWGTTRARLMESELTGRKPETKTPVEEIHQQQLDMNISL